MSVDRLGSFSVCLFAYIKNHRSKLHKIFVYAVYGRGLVLLWRYLLPVLWMTASFPTIGPIGLAA